VPLPAPAMHRRARRVAVLLGALAVLASACQVRVGTEVAVGRDGDGRLAVTIALDEELLASLDADDLDPFAGLDELPEPWSVDRRAEDGGEALTFTAPFADPAGLAQRVADLQDGLDDDDPVLLDGVELAVAGDGSATFDGLAGFRPPSSTGFDGDGVIAFDGDALEALLEDRGDEVMRVDLRVTLPGPIVDTNADEVDGATATWQLPTTELVEVRAVGDPPVDRTWWVVAGAAVLGLALGVVVTGLRRRRSAARTRHWRA
jgi:hypothetical protein